MSKQSKFYQKMILTENDPHLFAMEELHDTVNNITKNPDMFLSVDNKNIERIKTITKKLYDHLKSVETGKYKKVVPKLFLDGMTEEQIWLQIDLQNDKSISDFLVKTSNLLAIKDAGLKFQYKVEGDSSENQLEEDEAENDEIEENSQGEEEENELEEDEDDLEGDDDNAQDDNEKEQDSNQDFNDEEDDNRKSSKVQVDDEFFKLKELKRFLDAEDAREMKKMNQKGGKIRNSDDDLDLFQDLDSDDEDDDKATQAKYGDFFEKPSAKKKVQYDSDDEENEDFRDHEDEVNEKRVKFDLAQNQEIEIGSEDDEDEEEDKEETLQGEEKSTFEDRQDRLKKKIERLENKAINNRPWQLKGEITASARPENSLLEEFLEFDSATRPAPLITEETTKRLDDIIQQRIRDKAFDDVERKVKPTDGQNEFRKRLILDQTKSKESLSQIYEKEYLNQVEALKDNENVLEEEPKQKKEIREMMRQLFSKLDALTNYHFTPKPAAPEIRIITNTPAIEMEEQVPVAVSEATLLAPEEVKRRPKGDVLGNTERSKTDKKRERRQKKLNQKTKFKKAENTETNAGKMKKNELEKVTKSRNVQKMKEVGTGTELKSSKQFFSKLQDEVSKKSPKVSTKRKKETEEQSAKKFKL